jgi:hypothetical protein
VGPARLLRSGQDEYLMELAIGTRPVPFVALADHSGIDLDAVQTVQALLRAGRTRPSTYDTAASSSFSLVPCSSATCLPI